MIIPLMGGYLAGETCGPRVSTGFDTPCLRGYLRYAAHYPGMGVGIGGVVGDPGAAHVWVCCARLETAAGFVMYRG